MFRFAYVPCPHTTEALCEVLMETFLEWNVDSKLNTLTVDNCATNDAMINLMLDKFGSNQIWLKNFFHIQCAAHIINLIVKEGLEVIKPLIENVRDSVAYWTATAKRGQKFEEAARQIGVKYEKLLAIDCTTRWNSTYLMLDTAIPYRNVFSRLKLKETQYKCCPSDDDWIVAEDICERLAIFYKTTLLFSGTNYPTANLFFSEVCNMKLILDDWYLCGNEVVENMANKMIEKYEKYWNESHGFLAVAVVLDPRFKLSLIKYYYIKLFGQRGPEMVERVKSSCYDLLTLYEGKMKKKKNDSESTLASKSSSISLSSRGVSHSLSDYEIFLSQEKKGKVSHVKSELDNYLEEEQLFRSEEFDILAYWKTNLKYPILQAIARDVLAVPVSIVASESAFSTSGRVLNERRNRLTPKTLESLMCCQSWLTALEEGGSILYFWGLLYL